jgi:hypothetical protein
MLLEIRPIDSLDTIIFHKVFPVRLATDYVFPLYYYHVDIVRDNIIIIHYPELVTLYFINPTETASQHQLQKITFFDANDEKVVALAGTAIEDPTMSRIIVKSLSSDAYLFSTTLAASVEGIALSPKGCRVAVWTNSAMRVWDIASKSLLIAQERLGVIGVEFKGEGILLIRTSEGEKTVQFDSTVRAAGKLYLSTEKEENSLAIK